MYKNGSKSATARKSRKLSASGGIIGVVVVVVVEYERVPSVTLNVPEHYTERSQDVELCLGGL